MLDNPGDKYVFKKEDFLKHYTDIDKDQPCDIIIESYPKYGFFRYDGIPIYKNLNFKSTNTNKLEYIRVSKNEYTEEINFRVTDRNTNKKLSNMATMTMNVNAYDNQPPSIGSNELTINYGETKVYTVEDFTTNTTPAYSDPENDGPYKLKVTVLPTTGELLFDNDPVNVNDEILFVDIAKGLLTYVPDIKETDGYEDDDWEYEISDLGSQEYSESTPPA